MSRQVKTEAGDMGGDVTQEREKKWREGLRLVRQRSGGEVVEPGDQRASKEGCMGSYEGLDKGAGKQLKRAAYCVEEELVGVA
ncbi:hypothetical protein L7F22_001003, partial [Adiantum nelumboides]|nr:hypothetical protein [Adiantum nelumboides]